MSKCCATIATAVYLTGAVATQTYIYNHTTYNPYYEADKVAFSFIGAVFWLPYWLGVGAHALDAAITNSPKKETSLIWLRRS